MTRKICKVVRGVDQGKSVNISATTRAFSMSEASTVDLIRKMYSYFTLIETIDGIRRYYDNNTCVNFFFLYSVIGTKYFLYDPFFIREIIRCIVKLNW